METQIPECIIKDSIVLAEKFLLSCIRGGLAHSFQTKNKRWVKPYPEVTGYLVSYFSNNSKEQIPSEVVSAADFLLLSQYKNGGFKSFVSDKFLFTFDTAQIMKGMSDIYLKTGDEKYLESAKKCANFIDFMCYGNIIFSIFNIENETRIDEETGFYGGNTRYAIHCKNIEGLLSLFRITNDKKYSALSQLIFNCCSKNEYPCLTHPLAYMLEGFMAYGENDLTKKYLEESVIPRINNGFIAYSSDLQYSYVSGSMQLGILLYKAGFKKIAGEIWLWGKTVQDQHASGGLFQYANMDGSINTIVHDEINSWGTKYFCELGTLILTKGEYESKQRY